MTRFARYHGYANAAAALCLAAALAAGYVFPVPQAWILYFDFAVLALSLALFVFADILKGHMPGSVTVGQLALIRENCPAPEMPASLPALSRAQARDILGRLQPLRRVPE